MPEILKGGLKPAFFSAVALEGPDPRYEKWPRVKNPTQKKKKEFIRVN